MSFTQPPLGLYMHVPFCASTCDFCAFYQKTPKPQDITRYLSGIQQELNLYADWSRLQTVFWGGGTPSILLPQQMEQLGQTLLKSKRPLEWTVEMAPASVKLDKLKVLKGLGVNRISMGVQTFAPKLLEGLGRQHTLEQIYRAYDCIQTAGFQNINLDLIFAIPGQTLEEYLADIQHAVALNLTHISTYCLTFEEDTALFVKLSKGLCKINQAQEIEFYKASWQLLEANGYHQYEISNFAKAGYACIHNINTWKMHEWIGLGPAAASQYQRRRYTNEPSLEKWLKGLEVGQRSYQHQTDLNDHDLATDSLIFGLRMNAGVDLKALQNDYPHFNGAALEPLWQQLEAEGLLSRTQSRIHLTLEGRLVADAIAAEIV